MERREGEGRKGKIEGRWERREEETGERERGSREKENGEKGRGREGNEGKKG